MIVIIIVLSFLFISVGFIVTENNAKYLLSGYNTLSEEERQKIDIVSYIKHFRRFHIFLGVSFLFIALFLFYFVNPDWSGIFMGTYPILAYIYFLWKGIKFIPRENKKQKTILYFVIAFILFIFFFIIMMFKNSLADNKIEIKNGIIEVQGDYGVQIQINDVKQVELINELPELSSKVNGFALETIKKGVFKTKQGDEVKLWINGIKTPILYIRTKDGQSMYYSSKSISNEDVFNQINNALSNSVYEDCI